MVVLGGGVRVEVGGGEGRTNFNDTRLLNKSPCTRTTASRFSLKGEILLYTEFSLITYDRLHVCNSARISAFWKRSVEDKQDPTTLIVYRYYDLAAS